MSGDSDQFEKDLEEFFKDRAQHRSVSAADTSKKTIKQNRCDADDKEVCFPEAENPNGNMSGCCMTGCHNCPWGYKVI